ncbi:hypothetical protein C8R47DRAFT_1159533 [Mycena vitilis]|nr:hypothetical protein C8R47DRAFT_1159533 [Mycena vitilis]
MKITLGELDTTVDVGGRDVYTHVAFATRLLEIAQLAEIAATASGIWQSRDALPEVLRDRVPATHTNWKAYTDAIKAVDRVGLRESVVKARKRQELERTVADLRRGAPSAPLTPVSKMATQLARATLTTPRAATAPAPARAPAPTNPFGGGGGRGNLVFAPPEMTEEGRAQLRLIVQGLTGSMLQDDQAGREEYRRRLASWNRVHGDRRVLLERTGYPLSPGTAPPLSGECYTCGRVTVPWHRRPDCAADPVPTKESTFRSLCAKYLRPQAAVNAVLEEEDDLGWMDFVPFEGPEQDFGTGLSV